MSSSIYAPPEAEIQTVDEGATDYYVVSPTKFYLLSVVTINFYFIYWFYKNWRSIKVRDEDDSWPPMRSLFYIFFTHSLFVDVSETIKTQGRSFQWQPGATATLFVLLTISSNILGRLSWREIGSPASDIVGVMLMLLIPIVLLRGQRAINFASHDPRGETNAGFSLANWIWMILGGLMWLMILVGLYVTLFMPEFK